MCLIEIDMLKYILQNKPFLLCTGLYRFKLIRKKICTMTYYQYRKIRIGHIWFFSKHRLLIIPHFLGNYNTFLCLNFPFFMILCQIMNKLLEQVIGGLYNTWGQGCIFRQSEASERHLGQIFRTASPMCFLLQCHKYRAWPVCGI